MSNIKKELFIPRLMIAAPASGSGKTLVTVGITIALKKLGLKVATFKVGPDYLDPTYHEAASGRSCHNLDLWLMGREGVLRAFEMGTKNADIAVIEGVMGYFDGLSPTSSGGSSAELAYVLRCPVVLVVDASGMARSFVPSVLGFWNFESEKSGLICGVIANRVGSERHSDLLKKALETSRSMNLEHLKSKTDGKYVEPCEPQASCGPVYLGGILDQKSQLFRDRHLGLHSMRYNEEKVAELGRAEEIINGKIDLDLILSIARSAGVVELPESPACEAKKSIINEHKKTKIDLGGGAFLKGMGEGKSCRIGVAKDKAFDFYYEENLSLLKQAGAELIYFSPLNHARLPEDLDGVFIGGGYPELFATELSMNVSMLASIREFSALGRPIYAECGGFMYLVETICTGSNEGEEKEFSMVGLLPGRVVMCDRLQALGYVEVETQWPSVLGPAGTRYRGHQFRYSRWEGDDIQDVLKALRIRQRRDQKTSFEGLVTRNVFGSYIHAHWGSHPEIANNFVSFCKSQRRNDANGLRNSEVSF